MKRIIYLLIFILSCSTLQSQTIYSKSFGDKNNPAIIYLHGGPGYNCASFEATTAQKLADNGYFVIVYDRRGEGRSKDAKAQFTFSEMCADINSLYAQYGIEKSTLLGHSFGGIVATYFADSFPLKVQSIVLVGAPVSLQKTFKFIIAKSTFHYIAQNDSVNLKYIRMIEKMDTNSLFYSSYCFGHAMQNGAYSPQNPSQEAKDINKSLKSDTLLSKLASKMTYEAVQGFWKNEHYTTLDLTKKLHHIQNRKILIYGLYGKEDGLYSIQQIEELQNMVGPDNLKYLDNCSHSVFIDQQDQFLQSINQWLK